MRVLHVIGAFHHGGVERFVLDFVAAAKGQGVESRVLAVLDRSPGPLREAFEQEGAETFVCHLRQRSDAEKALRMAASGVDVVHSHLGVLSGEPFRWIRRSGHRAKLIAHEHTLVRFPFRYRAYELLAHRWTLRYADALAAVSEATGRRLAGRSGREWALIPPGIPMQAWQATGGRPEPGPPWRLLMAARFDPVKNHLFALDVAQMLVRRGFDFRLDLLGDGPLRPRVQAEIERRGLGGCISVHGAVENVAEWMRSAHLLLLPSQSEGAPRVLIEAAALGLPFLVSDQVDVSGMFQDATQKPLSVEEWVDAIQATQACRPATPLLDLSIERAIRDSLRLYGLDRTS